jgi:hypothetical protein
MSAGAVKPHAPGGHYEAFLGGNEHATEVLLSFLDRHLAAARASTR